MSNDLGHLRIIGLTASNIKRITAVEIAPEGDVVQITGKNEAGKSSVLDAIWWALEGKGAIQDKPIRRGEVEAYVRLDLGKVKIFRSFQRVGTDDYTTKLTVKLENGIKPTNPDTLLKSLINHLSIDPLEFSRMKPDKQYEIVKSFVPDFDFDGTEKQIKELFDERTALNRRLRDDKGRYEEGAADFANVPNELADDDALQKKLRDISVENAKRDDLEARRSDLRRRETAIAGNVEDINGEIERMKKRLASEMDSLERCRKAISEIEIPDIVDTSDIEQELAEARRINERVREKKRYAEFQSEYDGIAAKAEGLTDEITKLKVGMAKAIENAELPVDGMTISDGTVLLDGLPFDQASSARKLRTSMAIAMAMNPTIRVIEIREGSLLDSEGMKIVAEMAAEHDFQIWMERVDDSGEVGIVIEDGTVKAVNETPKPKEARAKKARAKK